MKWEETSGAMPEWTKGPGWKPGRAQKALRGSNPRRSAIFLMFPRLEGTDTTCINFGNNRSPQNFDADEQLVALANFD